MRKCRALYFNIKVRKTWKFATFPHMLDILQYRLLNLKEKAKHIKGILLQTDNVATSITSTNGTEILTYVTSMQADANHVILKG
jgi:hypothetical protein